MGSARTLPCTQSNSYTKIARLGLARCRHIHHPTIRAGALVHMQGHMTPHRLLQDAAAGNSLENTIFGTTYIFKPPCIRSNWGHVTSFKNTAKITENQQILLSPGATTSSARSHCPNISSLPGLPTTDQRFWTGIAVIPYTAIPYRRQRWKSSYNLIKIQQCKDRLPISTNQSYFN